METILGSPLINKLKGFLYTFVRKELAVTSHKSLVSNG
jgi:hypothetical protein